MIVELQGSEYAKAIGKYTVVFRKGAGKYVVKIISVDEDEKLARYEIMSGENKGQVMTGKYVPDRPLKVYDEDAMVKALLEV